MRKFIYLIALIGLAGCIHADSVVLKNSVVEAVVRPDIGRLISFRRQGEENWLWVAEDPKEFGSRSLCYGGLRVMLSPQRLWPQVHASSRSDPATDGGAWTVVSQSDTQLSMTVYSADLGVQVDWTIRILDGQAALAMDYEIRRVVENPFPVHLWSVVNVPLTGEVYLSRVPHLPEMIYYNSLRTQNMDKYVNYDPDSGVVHFLPGDAIPMKIGVFGRWIAQIKNQSAFVMCESAPEMKPYFENSNLQAFACAGKLPFYELEATSPFYALRPGESFHVQEILGLQDLPSGKNEQTEKIQSFVSKITESVQQIGRVQRTNR